MKIIKHWLVKLYQHSQHSPLAAVSSNWVSKKLIAEGYSKDKVTLPHRDGFIELLTAPSDAESTTYRADAVDSIVCTPVYEDEAATKNPSRAEMLEYIKTAIGEGYQPEHEAAVSDLAVIDGLNDGDLNREFGKCWQWYNMGGGFHETFEKPKQKSFEDAAKPLIKWLNESANPHTSVSIDATSAQLLTGEIGIHTEEFIKD
ncbi:hypothetical protein VC894_16920 [Citrobacter freundii]|nr:hypothetical protein [Citrobacter freundii]